ncbi:MAG: D-aminoacyl-tRNA deacylase [Candidatus Edwardsbacteria bacterium]
MRLVIQRVKKASVLVDSKTIGEIGQGLVILIGVGLNDTLENAHYLAEKVVNLRIFEDTEGKMNCSILEIGGEILAVSQFTLYGDCGKGRRPSFSSAAPPEIAEKLCEKFVEYLQTYGIKVSCGKFQAKMLVEIHNDGPVTFVLEDQ